MVELCSPESDAELALLESLLRADGVRTLVHNAHYGGLYPGMQIDILNARTILVAEADLARAREILDDFRARTGLPASRREHHWTDRARMLIEGAFLGWIMPGRRRPPPPEE